MSEVYVTPSEVRILEIECSPLGQPSVTDIEQRIIEIVTEGQQGPPGASQTTYTYQQVSPSSTWTINHNLGFKPSVELLNSGSNEIEGNVVHTSANQVIVQFTTAIAGFARLV